jgi:hypothetical protein
MGLEYQSHVKLNYELGGRILVNRVFDGSLLSFSRANS